GSRERHGRRGGRLRVALRRGEPPRRSHGRYHHRLRRRLRRPLGGGDRAAQAGEPRGVLASGASGPDGDAPRAVDDDALTPPPPPSRSAPGTGVPGAALFSLREAGGAPPSPRG